MIHVQKNYSLRNHNTFGLDVQTAAFVTYDSRNDIYDLVDLLKKYPKPMLHIGSGSNLLFTKDFEGTILHSSIKFIHESPIDDDSSVQFQVGSGVVWDDFCQYAAEKECYGIENLSYIPGEVGSAAVQNIGAYGADVSKVIVGVNTIDIEKGTQRCFMNEDCSYSYRESIFKKPEYKKYIVTSVLFRLSKVPKVNLEYGQLKDLKGIGHVPTAKEVRQKVIEIRRSKLPEPSELGSAGSFFKNPVISREKFVHLLDDYPDMPHYELDDGIKIPAAYLIEQCGWKGKSHGGAAVFEKQPLIIVNKGNATADDIVALASDIQASVRDRFGIEISPEVNYI